MDTNKSSNGKLLVILVIVVAVQLVLISLFIQQNCSHGKDFTLINQKLEANLAPIKKDIGDSKTMVNALLESQGKFNLALYGDEKNEGVIQKLNMSLTIANDLQKRLDERPKPAKPGEIKNLEQCKKEYSKLFENYGLCQEANNAKESSLVLFEVVKKNLVTQVSLLSGAVDGLNSQVENFQKIEKEIKESMAELDKAYRVNRFWGKVKTVGIGTVAGALAVVVLKAILK